MLNVNDTAPDFTLKNTDKEDVSLSNYNDKIVVMAFYPGAFTGVCDTEMCTLQDNLNTFNELDAVVLGISVDSPWANGAFSNKYNLEFNLLSDLDRKVTKDYDVVFEGLGGIEGYTCANRAVYIVKNGIIKYNWEAKPNPGVEPDYNEIKSTLKSL
ncbi:MAG: peroxiredoxin [Candidatus Marinimicrobia bacterium]|mgnify:FL=1|nr:peroxiredoxin [Candidatus Neomarinimicrobiota bacterium]